jgi:hypothetical protein
MLACCEVRSERFMEGDMQNLVFDFYLDGEQCNKKIRRISHLEKNLATGWTWDWTARYFIEQDGKVSEYNDLTTLRALTRDEI